MAIRKLPSSIGYKNNNRYNVLNKPVGTTNLLSVNKKEEEEKREQNVGGLLGALGFLGEKVAVGAVSSLEGIVDYLGSGFAKFFGNDAWAEDIIANDWFGDWYSHPEEWYNPDDIMRFAGDVAGGIGTSIPAMGATIGTALATGGASLAVQGVAGFGASFLTSGLGAAGRNTKEAYEQTGELGANEFGYGALSGATEGGLEGLTNLIGFGTGAIVKGLTKSLAKETGEALMKNVAVEGLKSFAGEAFEEGVSEWITPYWKRATYDPKAKEATPDEIIYSAVVGGVSGLVMDGGRFAFDKGASYTSGVKAANKESELQILEDANEIAEFENKNKTENELFSEIIKRRNKLSESLKATGGKAVRADQQMELGALKRATVAASVEIGVAKRAMNIVNNADTIAQRLTSYGYKRADGTQISYTADQLTAGYDKTRPQSIFKALKTNDDLRSLAISDFTGHLMMDTNKFKQATLTGERLASQADLNRFVQQASPEEVAAVSKALKIDSWSGLTAEAFKQKITDFLTNGGVQSTLKANELKKAFKAIPVEQAQGVPKLVNLLSDGTRRYTDGKLDIGVELKGDQYTVYDYNADTLSRGMSKGEVNSVFRDYSKRNAEGRMQKAELTDTSAATITPESQKYNKLVEDIKKFQSDTREIDSFAREHVKEYAKLSQPTKDMINNVIREGRKNGLSDEDVTMLARVSAHSGIDIQFDDSADFVRKTKSGEEITVGGFYEADKNRIVINPNGKRTAERLLIHELDHAITKDAGKNRKKVLDMYKTSIKNTDAEKQKAIAENYGGDLFTMLDETNAYYAEQVLGNKYTLEKLLEAEPTLRDKILSFFKGASTDYADVPKLSNAAKKYYKTYKKLFDEFSARNVENNSMENAHLSTLFAENSQKTPLTNTNQGNMSVSDKRYTVYSNKILDTIKKAIQTKGHLDTAYNQVQISKVTPKIAQMVKAASGGLIDISSKYVALNGSDIWHEYKRHSDSVDETGRRQITITPETMQEAIMAIYDPDIVESIYTTKDNPVQRQSFAYAKQSANGHYVVVEAVGGRKNPNITPVMVLEFNSNKWNSMINSGLTLGEILYEADEEMKSALDVEYNKKNRVTAAQFASNEAIANTPRSPRFDNSIPQTKPKSNSSGKISSENSSGKDFAFDIDSEGENISGAEVMGWLNKKPEGDELASPTISTVGKERVTYQEKFGSKEWRKTKTESAYIHAVDEMYGIQSYLEKVGKVKNAKAIIQNVRSTPHQAQSMIGSVQYNVFEADRKSAKKMGEGLNEIFRPIEKMGDKAAIDFDDYLLNYLNVDKYQVIEKTQRHDKDAAESLSKVREEISNLEDQRSKLENRIFNLGNSPDEVRIKEGLKKSIEKIDNEIIKSRSDEIALFSEAPGYAEAELKKVRNEAAELLGEKERAKAEIYTLGNDESQMKRKAELKERISNIESKLKRLEESAAAMEEIAKAYKIATKPVFNIDGTTISKEESQRLIKEYEKKYPEFKKIAQKVWNFNKNLNAMRVSAGLISKRISDRLAIMYPHYVPSFKAKINNNAQGDGGVSVASTIKKAKGYNSNIMSVKESMASQVTQVIRNGNINMLANKVYDTAVKSGDSKYVDIKLPDGEGEDISTEGIERPKPHTLTFFKEGKEYKIDISEEIYQGFKGIGEQSAPDSNVFARVTNWISDKYKKLVTSYSPAFMIRNAIRDMQDAGLNSKHPLLFARNISRAWVELVNNSENWQTYRAYGGFSSTVFDSKGVSGDVGARGFEILGIKDRIESGDKLSVKDAKYLKSIFTGVENLNAVVEQIPRFAEYLASIEAGETIEQAIYNSAEVTTNFGRRGATTKQLNATIIPFLNPAVQGFDKIFRNVTDAAKAGDAKAVTKAFGTLLGKAIAIGILPMLFNSLMYDDDEDYKDLREEDKENNYLIKLPNGTFLKLPRGRVASVIGGLYNRTAKMAKGEDADWLGYLENVKSQVTPVENLTRTVFSPFMDVAMNRTWYGTEIEGMQFENVRPRDRYDESTSSIAIAIGQVFNYSPKKIHYLIDQYSGVIGDFLLPATSKKAEKDFFSGNFTIDAATSNKISTNFYKLYDEARYSKTDGDVKAQYQLKYLNKVKAAASEMYKEINAIQSSNISAYEKLQQVRVLRVMINEAYKNAIADYEKIGAAIDATANMGYNDADTGDANIRYAEIIKQVYGAERALSEYNGTVYSNMTVLNTAGLSYDKLYDYYFGTKNIESDVDNSGKTISGSKRAKVVKAIGALGVSVEERLLLICASGYALKDGDIRGVTAEAAKVRLLKYILRMKCLTADERAEIAEMCGFEVRNGRIVNNFSKKLKKISKK